MFNKEYWGECVPHKLISERLPVYSCDLDDANKNSGFSIFECDIPDEVLSFIKDYSKSHATIEKHVLFMCGFIMMAGRYLYDIDLQIPLCKCFSNREELYYYEQSNNKKEAFQDIVEQVADLLTSKHKVNIDEINSILHANTWSKTLLFTITHCSKNEIVPFFILDLCNQHSVHVCILESSKIRIEFDNEYSIKIIKRLIHHAFNLLKDGIKNPDIPITELHWGDKGELEQILFDWNSTDCDFPRDKCLHEFVEEKASFKPEAIALIQDGKKYTRQFINNKANQIANYLIRKGIKEKDIIAIYIRKSWQLVAGLLGILKSGCAYLPIDANYPIKRIEYMLRDSNAKVVLIDTNLEKNISHLNLTTIFLDRFENEISDCSEFDLKRKISPLNPCYIIYTSGSTGHPKGVLLNHLGRVNNFNDFISRFDINENDSLLAISSLSFDMSVFDILGSLSAGAYIVFPNNELEKQSFHWLKLINQYKITIWHSVPVLLELLVKSANARRRYSIDSLRLFLLGGDWIPVLLPDAVRNLSPNGTIISLGGATEVSMDSTIYEVGDVNLCWPSIPYGKPMRNQRTYILDENLQPLPIGVPGELYIGGIGVGEGYYNKKEITAQRFIPNPWIAKERIYKTGDRARYYIDGNIQLLGRLDFQVKINGVRIELGEIESKIKDYPNVKNSIVIITDGDDSKKFLIAYVLSEKLKTYEDAKSLNTYLYELLPKEYIPSGYIFTPSFPLTPNGKINRNIMKKIHLNEVHYL